MKIRSNKLKGPTPDKGKIVKQKYSVNVEAFDHPIFCFKYIHSDYALSQCSADEKVALLEQIIRLSTMSWNEIQLAPKHGMGSEKIHVDSIKPNLPNILTDDVKHLLALRFIGKAPFVGWRNKFIFHVFYIDRGFNLYSH